MFLDTAVTETEARLAWRAVKKLRECIQRVERISERNRRLRYEEVEAIRMHARSPLIVRMCASVLREAEGVELITAALASNPTQPETRLTGQNKPVSICATSVAHNDTGWR